MCLSGRAESWLATLFMAKNRQMVNWLGLSSAEQLVDKHHSIHFTNWALSIFIQLRCPFWSRPQKLLSAFVGILSEVMGIGVWFSDQICTASKEFRIAPPRNCDIRWRVKGWGAQWCRDKIFDKRYHRSLHVKQHSGASSLYDSEIPWHECHLIFVAWCFSLSENIFDKNDKLRHRHVVRWPDGCKGKHGLCG